VFQGQLANYQQLLKQANAEKDVLRADLSASLKTIATKTSYAESIGKKLQQLQQEHAAAIAQATPSPELVGSLGGILDQAVKVGMLSFLVGQRADKVSTIGDQFEPEPVENTDLSCFTTPQPFITKTVDTSSPKNQVDRDGRFMSEGIRHHIPPTASAFGETGSTQFAGGNLSTTMNMSPSKYDQSCEGVSEEQGTGINIEQQQHHPGGL